VTAGGLSNAALELSYGMYIAVVLFVATQWYELCDVYRGSAEVEVLNEEGDALILDLAML